MLTCKKDCVNRSDVRTDGKHAFITICGKEYRLKKSANAINYSPVHVSDVMTGKMQGIVSISTSCVCNPICKARHAEGASICAHCFAFAILDGKSRRGKALQDAMISNFELLNSCVLSLDLLPVFPNLRFCRIESFGDVASVTQAINYCNICKVNPHVTFAWWSKNLSIIKRAFDLVGGKPENVIFVQSSRNVNERDERDAIADKVFTVYTQEYAQAHGININCGARSCASCLHCYLHNDIVDIAELLK